ncbi:DUF2304 domain-containing protein [Methanobacterium alcaliphilum]|uniref:DUF2304 domain-containing protein n=1 Tax=Methanobacterium alcaliphilum TaxID=392018 RepID=UPI00200B8BB7|nr:DUF2304 family protein [Methanobacterium alcaliphilum]MCK9152412.1 DUF2304 family protein [Methanobacterium alcaliphilum]
MIIQPIGIIIGILGIVIVIFRFREGKSSLGMLGFWLTLWLLIIGVSIYPESTTFFANLFGIGRGLDLILILGLIGCYYLIFKIYTLIEQVEGEITELVRQIAIKNENLKVDDSENSKIQLSNKNKD